MRRSNWDERKQVWKFSIASGRLKPISHKNEHGGPDPCHCVLILPPLSHHDVGLAALVPQWAHVQAAYLGSGLITVTVSSPGARHSQAQACHLARHGTISVLLEHFFRDSPH